MVAGRAEDEGVDDRQPETHRGEAEQHDDRLVEDEGDAKPERGQHATGAHQAWCAEASHERVAGEAPNEHCHRERGEPEGGKATACLEDVTQIETPAAFYRLRNVRAGTDIKVRRKDGTTVSFTAERSEWVDKDNFPTQRVYGRTRLPTLRLVTCGGAFDSASGHYEKNLIVYATRKPS